MVSSEPVPAVRPSCDPRLNPRTMGAEKWRRPRSSRTAESPLKVCHPSQKATLMTRNWKIRYLANVLTVLDVDGELTPRETLFSSILQKKLGLKACQVADALLLARHNPPDVYIHDTDMTNAQNLVDMIVAKKLDGAVVGTERRVIDDYINATKLPPWRVETLRQDAERKHARVQEQIETNITKT